MRVAKHDRGLTHRGISVLSVGPSSVVMQPGGGDSLMGHLVLLMMPREWWALTLN